MFDRTLSRRSLIRRASIASLVIGAAALAGCGTTQEAAPAAIATTAAPAAQATTAAAAPAQPKAITMRFMTRGSGGEQTYFELVGKNFEKKNPHIKVGVEPQEDYHVNLVTQVAAGTPADLVFTTNDFMWEEAINGLLLDLKPWVTKAGVKAEDYYPAAWEPQFLRGHQFAMPLDMGVWALWYNKDLFSQDGVELPRDNWTMEDFLTAARKLTKDSNGKTADDPAFDYTKSVQWGTHGRFRGSGFTIILEGMGGRWANDDFSAGAMNTPEGIAAFQWIADMSFKCKCAISPSQPPDFPVGIVTGKTAMQERGSWTMTDLNNVTFDWDVVPMPAGPAKWATIGEASGLSTPRGAKYPDEAWELNYEMTGPEGQALGFTQAYLPSVPSQIAVAEKVYASATKPANIRSLLAKMPDASFPYYQEAIQGRKLDDAFQSFWDEMYVQGKPASEVVPRMNDAVTEILKVEKDLQFPPGLGL